MGRESLGENSSAGPWARHGEGEPAATEKRVVELSPKDLPSTNKLYNNIPGKGRRKTARYNSWLFTAGWELRVQKVRPLHGRVHLEICLPDREGRAPDADNVLKATIDLLVRHRVIDGDDKKVVRSVTVRWAEEAATVRITIRRADIHPAGSDDPSISTPEVM
jgi:Holliday junction resolvase RusA-like endonuclease